MTWVESGSACLGSAAVMTWRGITTVAEESAGDPAAAPVTTEESRDRARRSASSALDRASTGVHVALGSCCRCRRRMWCTGSALPCCSERHSSVRAPTGRHDSPTIDLRARSMTQVASTPVRGGRVAQAAGGGPPAAVVHRCPPSRGGGQGGWSPRSSRSPSLGWWWWCLICRAARIRARASAAEIRSICRNNTSRLRLAQGGGGALLLALGQQPVTHRSTPAGRCLHPPQPRHQLRGTQRRRRRSQQLRHTRRQQHQPCSTDATPGTAGSSTDATPGTAGSSTGVSSAGTTGTASSGSATAASVHNMHRTLVRLTDNIWTPPTGRGGTAADSERTLRRQLLADRSRGVGQRRRWVIRV